MLQTQFQIHDNFIENEIIDIFVISMFKPR